MASTTIQFNLNPFGGLRSLRRRVIARGLWLGLILLAALVAFELFNFATTEFALQTLFGERDALGVATWASVLAIAFCGIDFAGLSRLFTPETGRKEPKEVWLLTGAWFLGASMNAIMTWWAVGSALSANPNLGNDLLSRQDILLYGPIFIAALVWLTRILIIGTFAFAGDHIFSTAERYGNVVDGLARPSGRIRTERADRGHDGGGNWFKRNVARRLPRSQPRAMPQRTPAPALSSRNEPLASSSYARAADSSSERRVYGAQRSFFGRGAGEDDAADGGLFGRRRGAESRPSPAPARSIAAPAPAYASAAREAYTPPTQRTAPAAQMAQVSPSSAEPASSYTSTWGTSRSESTSRSERPARPEPARAASAAPSFGSAASSASSNASTSGRASTVRTVGSAFTRDPRSATHATTTTVAADDPEDRRAGTARHASNELEYVDLD